AGMHRSVRRSIEKCFDAVPIERIDKTTLRDLRFHTYEIAIEQLDQSSWVETLCERGEIAQIGEQNAHGLGNVFAGFDTRYVGTVQTYQEFVRYEPPLCLDQTSLVRIKH